MTGTGQGFVGGTAAGDEGVLGYAASTVGGPINFSAGCLLIEHESVHFAASANAALGCHGPAWLSDNADPVAT